MRLRAIRARLPLGSSRYRAEPDPESSGARVWLITAVIGLLSLSLLLFGLTISRSSAPEPALGGPVVVLPAAPPTPAARTESTPRATAGAQPPKATPKSSPASTVPRRADPEKRRPEPNGPAREGMNLADQYARGGMGLVPGW